MKKKDINSNQTPQDITKKNRTDIDRTGGESIEEDFSDAGMNTTEKKKTK